MVQPPWPKGWQELVSAGGLSCVCGRQEFVCSELQQWGFLAPSSSAQFWEHVHGETCCKNRKCEAAHCCWLKLCSTVFHWMLDAFEVTFEKVSAFFLLFFPMKYFGKKLLNFLWELTFQFKIQRWGRRPELCEKFSWRVLAATAQCVFELGLFKTGYEELWAVSIITATLYFKYFPH